MAKNQARYQEALRKGYEYNANGQWQDALLAFRVAIGEFPKRPEPYVGLGEACFGLKQLDRALECYKLAARYSGGDVSYLQKVADIQERLGQLGDAARTYAAAGELLLRQRELQEAVGNWERAIRLDPNLLVAHQRLATVFQRLDETKKAVREYVAIARILQMQGEKQKALRMCQAALRLDPGNEQVLMAIDLIKHGEDSLRDEEEEEFAPPPPPEPEPAGGGTLAEAVRQMANILETETREQQQQKAKVAAQSDNPVATARRLAQEQLAEEIFRDEDDDMFYGGGEGGLSKLERDALIGQAMDFESRGRAVDAISCYEKVIAGGLKLPAAYFSLGMLYLDQQQPAKAQKMLSVAAKEDDYAAASQQVLSRI